MFKRNLVSLGALGVFSILAAGSTPDIMEQVAASGGSAGGGSGNVEACTAYVEQHNSLSCVQSLGVTYEPADMCPDALNLNPNDMSEYYQCMADNSQCDGDIPKLDGLSNCEMPF